MRRSRAAAAPRARRTPAVKSLAAVNADWERQQALFRPGGWPPRETPHE